MKKSNSPKLNINTKVNNKSRQNCYRNFHDCESELQSDPLSGFEEGGAPTSSKQSPLPSIQPHPSSQWCRYQGLLILFTIAFVSFLVYYDFDQIRQLFDQLVAWIKEHPVLAVGVIVSAYHFLLLLALPTFFLTITCGYIYARALNSTTYGLLVALLVSLLGSQTGSYSVFFLSRYCL